MVEVYLAHWTGKSHHQVAVGDPLQAVRQALWKALPQDSLARMKSVMHSGTVAPFFQTIEVETLQRAICGALDIDPAWALQDFETDTIQVSLAQCCGVEDGRYRCRIVRYPQSRSSNWC